MKRPTNVPWLILAVWGAIFGLVLTVTLTLMVLGDSRLHRLNHDHDGLCFKEFPGYSLVSRVCRMGES